MVDTNVKNLTVVTLESANKSTRGPNVCRHLAITPTYTSQRYVEATPKYGVQGFPLKGTVSTASYKDTVDNCVPLTLW